MHKPKGGRLTSVALLTLVALFLPAFNSAASAAGPAAFFRGRTIKWIVPYKAGGGYDIYSRLITPYLEKYTGATVVIGNKPGAGGLVGVNLMAASRPDGLTIAIVNGVGSTSAEIAREPGMRFDLTKLSWLARVAGEPKVWVVRSSLPGLHSVKEFLNSRKTYRWGAMGPGSNDYLLGQLLEGALGAKFDLITGFDGTVEITAAINRKEIDMTGQSVDSRLNSIRNGDERPLLLMDLEPSALLPKAPTLSDVKNLLSPRGFALLKTYAAVTSVSRAVAAPPGLRQDRLEFLREAFRKALTDPALLARARKMHRPIEYMSGKAVQQAFEDAVEHSPRAFRQLIVSAYRHGKKR